MKIRRLLATALTIGAIMLAGTATADIISVPINFDGDDIAPFSYAFEDGGTTSNSGQCPDDVSLDTPCVQLNKGASLIITVATPPATFDLMSFWWRNTGNQEQSELEVTFLPDGSLGTLLGAGTVFELVQQTEISQITFKNPDNAASVVRLDGITLTYDDGLNGGPTCENGQIIVGGICVDPEDPVGVPEPGTLGLLGLGLLGLAARRRRKV